MRVTGKLLTTAAFAMLIVPTALSHVANAKPAPTKAAIAAEKKAAQREGYQDNNEDRAKRGAEAEAKLKAKEKMLAEKKHAAQLKFAAANAARMKHMGHKHKK